MINQTYNQGDFNIILEEALCEVSNEDCANNAKQPSPSKIRRVWLNNTAITRHKNSGALERDFYVSLENIQEVPPVGTIKDTFILTNSKPLIEFCLNPQVQ